MPPRPRGRPPPADDAETMDVLDLEAKGREAAVKTTARFVLAGFEKGRGITRRFD